MSDGHVTYCGLAAWLASFFLIASFWPFSVFIEYSIWVVETWGIFSSLRSVFRSHFYFFLSERQGGAIGVHHEVISVIIFTYVFFFVLRLSGHNYAVWWVLLLCLLLNVLYFLFMAVHSSIIRWIQHIREDRYFVVWTDVVLQTGQFILYSD